MIKLENVVLASPEQMEFIIEGMRNPMNSWGKSDSGLYCPDKYDGYIEPINWKLGPNDHSLMQRLSNAGTDHRKFMRMMPVYVRITAPLYWWKEFDTYKVGTVANSCSTMHKIAEKEFTLEDFSTDQLLSFSGKHNDERDIPTVMSDEHNVYSPKGILECVVIPMLNECRNLYLNGIDRGGMWIESLPYSELIIQKEQRGKQQLINSIDPDTATDTAVDYAVQMAKDAARHYNFEKEE